MLDVKTRQKYLKELGFYKGEIDGSVGKLTKAAYLALQKKYFKRAEDIDGLYGNDTDKLLQNAYRVKKYCKNFKLEEFRCSCGKYCTGYPVILDTQLLKDIQLIRNKYGSTTITSGIRCSTHNRNVGGVSNSRHKSGKALDFRCSASLTESGRKQIMNYFKKLPGARYTYCNIGGNYPNMGRAVHIDVV